MSTGQLIRLTTMGIVFLLWAWTMFRTLFLLRQRDTEGSGAMVQSTGGFLRQLGYWLRSPEDRADRKTLLFLTAALAVMIVMQVMSTVYQDQPGAD